MTKQGVRLYRVVPGANALTPLIVRFCREGEGTITSFEDSLLPAIKEIVGENQDVEIVPLGILVKRCLTAAGELAGQIATRTQYLGAIAQAASNLEENSHLRRSLRFAGNLEAVAELFDEFDGWRIDYREIAESPEIGSELSRKLLELRRLRSGAVELLSKLNRNLSSDQLKQCSESFLEPDVRLPRIMVTIGSEVAPSKIEWLRWLIQNECNLTLVAPRHAIDPAMFEDANLIAEELGCSQESIGSGNLLSNNLFANEVTPAISPRATIVIASTPISECEEALANILEEGESEVAIFVRDLETYAPLLDATALAMNVSLRLPRRTDLLDNAFARLALDCIEACSKDDVRRFVPLLKRSYFTLPKENRRFLEDAIAEARKDLKSQWEILAETIDSAPDQPSWFRKLLEWRTLVVQESNSLLGWNSKLRDLGDILPWHDAFGVSEEYDPKRDERAFHVMQTSLSTQAQLESVSGEAARYSLKGFARRCREIWTNSDVSIPAATEGVPVIGSVWAIPPVKRLIVLGMLEGVFPRRRRENPILGDLERQEISRSQPESRPLKTSFDASRKDRESFYSLCSSASEVLRFSYPATGEDRDNIPTFYLQRVKDALKAVETVDRSVSKPPTIQNVNTAREDFAQEPTSLEILSRSRDLAITPRALQDALNCPLRFQLRHRLELYPRARTAAWYNLRLLPSLARLFSCADAAIAETELKNALRQELDRLLPELEEWELRLLNGGGERLITEWVRREFLARKIWPKTEESYGDRALGGSGVRDMMPGAIRLSAKVAGVSHLNSSSKVLHLYDASAPQGAELSDEDQLYYGLYFLASYEPGMEAVIEVDGMDGSRSLLVLDRMRLPNLISSSKDRIRVVDLSGSKTPDEAKREFGQRTKRSLAKAIEVVELGAFQATPGPHCEHCDYGELCRQSIFFSDKNLDEVVST